MKIGTSEWLDNGVTAHRGWSTRFPENTLPAFEAAIRLGADWLEMDIRTTKDGKLVVIHDAETGRIGDISLAVAGSTYERLAEIDAAHQFRTTCGNAAGECPKARIPLLEEGLRSVMSQKRTRASLQPKDDCVDGILKLAEDMGAVPWIGFNDGDVEKMRAVKRHHPSIPVFWDRCGGNLENDIEEARRSGFEAIVVHAGTATAETAAAIKSAGIEPGVWTVDDKPGLLRMLTMGFARVYTDAPDLLLELRK